MFYEIMHQDKAISEQCSKFLFSTGDYELCINTKQFQNEVLDFFVVLIMYGLMHENRAVSEQSSKFLCNTGDYGIMLHDKAISEQSSKFLCNTDKLLSMHQNKINSR